ncbi:MAG: helix-turn-helix transcriptional regulator [Allosphingosinicella sp.]|uniref:S24 family peptidase n=1 Tax=Allosphingosinicella sp. TaxID=2823234 RepID=UPI0039336844
MDQPSHSCGTPQRDHRIVGQSLHVAEDAIIGSSAQAESSDNRVCDNRSTVPYGFMDVAQRLSPEAAEVFARLDALRLKQRELAEVLNLEPNKISKVRAGERQLKASEYRKASEWLAAKEAGVGAIQRVEPDIPPVRPASADDEVVEITSLDLTFSMGPGTNLDDYIEETPLRFDLSYIRGFTRTTPTRLRIARGVGESMFPTLISSDLVWIDTTQRMLNQQDRIWAISLYGAAAIKRLRAIGDGKVMVISDNRDVENQIVDAEDLIIGGRVIRFSRDL